MSNIIPHSLGSTESFWTELIRHFESVEGLRTYVYSDSLGVPTFGIGYALLLKIKGVWTVRPNINDRLSSIAESLNEDDKKVLEDVAKALNKSNKTEAINLVDNHIFNCDGITEDEARTLLRNIVENEYISALRNRIGSTLYNQLANSKEMIALLSIVYQGWTGAIKQPLIDALSYGNRAEAWYQIRYAMNTSNAGWMANRRYQEADEFGLYENGSAPSLVSEDEAKEIMRMYTIHKNAMHIYEIAYPPPLSQDVLSIDTEILKAKVVLVTNYGQGQSIENVIIGKGLDSYSYQEQSSLDKIIGTTYNDLIFGEKGNDIIDGEYGEDVIYGGEGNDMITGGTGNDYIEGGAGNDIYYINTGDGTDTIEDKEGENRVIVNGKEVGLLIRQDDGTYKNPDGKITATVIGGELILTDATTGTTLAKLNQNFQDGDFGIHLLDIPDTPQTNNTIVGDLSPLDFDPDAEGIQSRIDEWGNVITDPTNPDPNKEDILYDTSGSDHIEGKGGDDYINAKHGGNDWLLGGSVIIRQLFEREVFVCVGN